MNKQGQRTLLAADPSISCNQPVPLTPRPMPPQPVYPTDWSRKTGAFVIQDVYHGQGLEGVARGSVEKIRVVALDYMATDIGRKHGPSAISDLAAWDVKVVLGEAPVHEDGSAAFEVPARTPVYFQAIDAAGHVVQTMRSWSTLMPGEVFSCIGCHESKNETVEAKPATLALQAGIQPLDPMDKLSCWIDLALPHSGDWTEGMTSEDKESYQRVYQKRLDWQKQEAANIRAYLDAQKDATQSARY